MNRLPALPPPTVSNLYQYKSYATLILLYLPPPTRRWKQCHTWSSSYNSSSCTMENAQELSTPQIPSNSMMCNSAVDPPTLTSSKLRQSPSKFHLWQAGVHYTEERCAGGRWWDTEPLTAPLCAWREHLFTASCTLGNRVPSPLRPWYL